MTAKNRTLQIDELLEDIDGGEDDVMGLIRANRGQGRAETRHSSDYRRSNRYVDDGYGDQDFS